MDRRHNLPFVCIKLMYVSTETHLFVDRNRKILHAPVYVSPTNAKVATLILTLGGKTVRKAVKQAIIVEPVVNT